MNGLAGSGVPNVGYGVCNKGVLDSISDAFLLPHGTLPFGFTESDAATGGSLTGVPVQLDGKQLANTPPYTISFGGQYTMPVGGGFNLTSRADFYWQAASWGRIFNDPADHMRSYSVANALFTLNAPDNAWYVSAYARNIFGANNQTGQYLTSSSRPVCGLACSTASRATSASRSAPASKRTASNEIGAPETGAPFLFRPSP